jgi:general stress protein 26
MSEPKADRPHMPGYGIASANEGPGLFGWSWAIERLTNARTYWIATARSNGQPHVMPVWGVWIDGAFYFSTGTRSRKARNLVENPRCAISCEVGEDQLIIEGQAQLVDDPEMRRRFGSAYQTKYDFDMEGFNEPFYSVQPSLVFGFTTADGQFTKTATRWSFNLD